MTIEGLSAADAAFIEQLADFELAAKAAIGSRSDRTHAAGGLAHTEPVYCLNEVLLAHASRVGLLRMEVPIQLGGLGLSFKAKCVVAARLAGIDFSLAMAIVNSHNIAALVASQGSETARRRWLEALMRGESIGCTAITEYQTGSDASAITLHAREQDSAWILNGEKAWIINAQRADCIHVYAQTAPGSGARGIASFIVDVRRDGFERLEPMVSASTQALGTGAFRLRNYRCDSHELIAAPGMAFKAAMGSINAARIYVAAMCCGLVDVCLQEAARFGRERASFGQTLISHQGWRWSLAQAAVELDAAKALVATAAHDVDRSKDVRAVAARAKVFATQCAQRQIPLLMHLLGAQGLMDARPFQRHLMAAQMASLTDGATEILLDRIGHEFNVS